MSRDERIAAIREELSGISATVTALFHELDDLEVYGIATISDERQMSLAQQILGSLAADNLP